MMLNIENTFMSAKANLLFSHRTNYLLCWLEIKHVFEIVDGTPEIATSVALLPPRNDSGWLVNSGTGKVAGFPIKLGMTQGAYNSHLVGESKRTS